MVRQQVVVFYAKVVDDKVVNEVKQETWDSICLANLQSAVGGRIEGLGVPKHNLRIYLNEEGMLRNLPENVMGTQVLRALGLPCHPITTNYSGTIVLLSQGEFDDEGLTEKQLSLVLDVCKTLEKSRLRQIAIAESLSALRALDKLAT